ncbi:MAG TPA: DUF6282 family protein [Chloroflexota bacterium]|nr:DUF6282 family protein [Chloroflexota bacterium]
MVETGTVRALLQGSYDLHVHSAPDIMKRKGSDLVMARRAAAAGIQGMLFKSHNSSTADRVAVVNETAPGCRAYGALTLCHAVGGLNAAAVDVAARLGARLVWFPTMDAANEVAYQDAHPNGKKAYWFVAQQELRQQRVSRPPISIIDGDGALVPAVHEILEVIAAHDMVLATGHLGVTEIVRLVAAAKAARVQRIIVSHPEYPSVAMPIVLQVELARQGMLMERCYRTPYSGKIGWEEQLAAIRAVGPSASIVCSDMGQVDAPWPEEALFDFVQRLLEAGFTTEEVRVMTADNPRSVIEL